MLQIPFAKPPLGDLRFKKPIPVDPWPQVYDANRLPNSCPQNALNYFPGFSGEDRWNPKTPISEDCLYLNLWVPTKLNQTGSYSVLIWIHGGGYFLGTSAMDFYDGQILASKNDIIVATINYRLGVLGFLYLGNEDAPGNMAMYDQILAIEWIKNNIQSFGGDPNSLTLFGHSAGAASISSHLLSPISRHLVRRVILQSGTVNAPWGFLTAEKSTEIANSFIDSVGCGLSLSPINNDTLNIMKCLRTTDVEKLLMAQEELFKYRRDGILNPTAPTIDGIFLPASPKSIMIDTNWFSEVEILIGNTQDEGDLII